MDWTQPETLLLIAAYERHSCLGNTGLTEYRSRTKKQDAWRNIGTEFKISADDAETKMKSVLSSYRREKRKVMLSKKSGSGTDDVFQPSWFAYERFNFMRNINKPRKTRESCQPIVVQTTDAAGSNSENSPGTCGEGNQEELDHHNDPGEQNLNEVAQRRQEEPSTKRLKPADKAQLAFDTMQALVSEKREKRKDSCATYGEMVAHKLRLLPNEYQRAVAQRQIDGILYNMVIVALREQSGDASCELSVASHSSSD